MVTAEGKSDTTPGNESVYDTTGGCDSPVERPLRACPGRGGPMRERRLGRRDVLAAAGAGLAGFGTVTRARAQEDPTEITDWFDLDAVREDMAGEYVLVTDLDETTTGYDEIAGPDANDGREFDPIGEFSDGFTGAFDGADTDIRDLRIDRPGEDYVGLFGQASGELRSVTLVEFEVTGSRDVGGLVGRTTGTVEHSTTAGAVTGERRVGGLAGSNDDGTITRSEASTEVTGEDSFAGGLVGHNDGTIAESEGTGSVTGEDFVGGLTGISFGTVVNSAATGAVTGESFVGGLVGENSGTVDDSSASGDVTGTSWVGTLVGRNPEGGTIRDSVASGSVTGERNVGGLVGDNDGTVENSEVLDNDDGGGSDDGGGDENEDSDADAGGDDDADGFGPGFGVGGALAGLGGAGYLLRRRLADGGSE